MINLRQENFGEGTKISTRGRVRSPDFSRRQYSGFVLASSFDIRASLFLSWSILQNAFDPLHNRLVELVDEIARFHVLADLPWFRCASDDGADVWIL
jgi:hypothetical protein